MGRKFKAVKTIPNREDRVKVDRISGLPDHLLCQILSFLDSTKEAAATSVLSTRWRYLFASLPDIDLVFEEKEKDKKDSVQKQRLNDLLTLGLRVFVLRNGAPVRRFKLSVWLVYKCFGSSLDSMLSSALLCQVQELEIYVGGGCYAVQSMIPRIFTCQSLVCLKLVQHRDWDVPDLIVLPKLKILHLQCSVIVGDWVQRLFEGCPVLEDLTLRFSCDDITKVFEFSSPSVKKLDLMCHGQCTVFVNSANLQSLEYFSEGQNQVDIDAPNLEHFFCYARGDIVNFIQGPNSLVRTRFSIGWPGGLDPIGHLNRVQNVKFLSLPIHMLEAVCSVQDLLPTFNNLTTLELLKSICLGGVARIDPWRVLPSLFAKASKLEALIFEQVVMDSICEGREEFEFLFPEIFPTCFVQRLKEIKIKRFYKKEYEFTLVEYFLQNGKALKKMTISIVPLPANCETILSFKRCSEDCQIVLDVANDWISMHERSRQTINEE